MLQRLHLARPSRVLLGWAALLAAASASAADVGVSVNISEPGFWGRVDIGTTPPPLVYAQPVIITPGRVHERPIYLRVPPGQEKKWSRYCARYDACGRPVYFVRADAPPQSWHQHGGPRDDRGRDGDWDDRRDDGPGKGHGRGHDRGHGHGRGHD